MLNTQARATAGTLARQRASMALTPFAVARGLLSEQLNYSLALTMSTTETVANQSIAPVLTLATPEQIASFVPGGATIRSKKDALALAKSAGVSRRAVENALAKAWRDASANTAAFGAAELSRAASLGHKVDRKVSKTGRVTYAIASKPMGEKTESKTARLERENAELRARLASVNA